MIKRILIFCFCSSQVFSQMTFEKTYSLFQNPQMYFIQELYNGGFIVCGKSQNLSDSTTDFCFLKTDFSGNVIWAKQIFDTTLLHGSPSHEWATTIREKPDNSFVFGGSVRDPHYSSSVAFYGWMDSSGTILSSISKHSDWTTSVNALLLNTNGNIISTRDDREGAGHYGNYLEINSPSGQFISGGFTGNNSIANQALVQMKDGGFGTLAIEEEYNSGSVSFPLVTRFDVDGNIVWKNTLHNEIYTSDTQFVALCPTSDTGIVVCGFVKGGNIILTKINANGDSLWTKSIAIAGKPSALQQTLDGGFAVLGTLNNSLMLLKVDGNANYIWMQTYNNTPGNASGIYFHQTADEGFIILGQIENASPETIYLVKTDGNGNVNTITKTGKVDPAKVFNLYPDPFPSSINVDIPGNHQCLFLLCDVTGRIIFSKKINGESDRLDLSFLPSGVYCAFIKGDAHIGSKILMKQ